MKRLPALVLGALVVACSDTPVEPHRPGVEVPAPAMDIVGDMDWIRVSNTSNDALVYEIVVDLVRPDGTNEEVLTVGWPYASLYPGRVTCVSVADLAPGTTVEQLVFSDDELVSRVIALGSSFVPGDVYSGSYEPQDGIPDNSVDWHVEVFEDFPGGCVDLGDVDWVTVENIGSVDVILYSMGIDLLPIEGLVDQPLPGGSVATGETICVASWDLQGTNLLDVGWSVGGVYEQVSVEAPLYPGATAVTATSGSASLRFEAFEEKPAVCNPPPVATDDAASTNEDTPVVIVVLANDTDPEFDPLTVSGVTQPSNGTATINSDNTVTYTPNPNFYGNDQFTYSATDPGGLSDQATVVITVYPVNDPPIAVDDVATTDEDTPVDIDVLANDSDVDGDGLTLSSVGTPSHGAAVINAGKVTYTPSPNYYGADHFTYETSDGNGGTDQATVYVTVDPVPDVVIEIKPEDNGGPNAINSKSNGLVAVAILGMPGEYALTDIDWTTLAFGPAGATAAHDLSDPEAWSDHVMDVNGNGAPDLVTHYRQKDTGLAPGDTEACLTGMVAGKAITACGPVTVR